MKRTFLVCFAAALALIVGACFSPWKYDETVLSLQLKANASGASFSYPPDILPRIEHIVKIIGPTGEQTLSFKGTEPVRIAVAPGYWSIQIQAFLNGQLYAEGATSGKYDSGNNTIAIVMNVIFSISSITVVPQDTLILRGSTIQFAAYIGGIGSGSTSGVTWSVSGQTQGDTTIDSAGLLTVSALEPEDQILVVTAVSAADPTKKGSTTITVTSSAIVHAAMPSLYVDWSSFNQTVPMGASSTLRVIIMNSGFISGQSGTVTYEWFKKPLLSGTPITSLAAGTTVTGQITYTVQPVTQAELGEFIYYVKVTNTIPDNLDGGVKTQTSTSGDIEIWSSRVNAVTPVLSGLPQYAQKYVEGSGPSLTVQADNAYEITSQSGTLSYEWSTAAASAGPWTVDITQTTSTYTLTDTAGVLWYRVKVTNTIPNNMDGGTKTAGGTSAPLQVTIFVPAVVEIPVLSGSTADITYSVGGSASPITVTVTNDAAIRTQHSGADFGTISCQWFSSAVSAAAGGTPVTSPVVFYTNAFSFTPPTDTNETVYYYAEVINTIDDGAGDRSETVTWGPVKVTVNP